MIMRLATLLLAILCGGGLALGQAEKKPNGRYLRFPETISPDGEYVFAWGNSLAAGVPLETLVEAPYGAWIDPEAFEIQDYLVETRRIRSPLALPGFEYFSGAKGHEDKHGLAVSWSPDSKGVLAVYESDAGYVSAVWVEPAERRVSEVGKTFETTLRDLVADRFGEEEANDRRAVLFSRMAVLAPRIVTIDGCLNRFTTIPQKPTSYWFRMRFSILTEGDTTRAALVTSRFLHPDELPGREPVRQDESLEDGLEKALATFRTKLSEPAAEALNKEQALWLKQRDALANAWNRTGFTRHRIEELKIRAAEYEPPQAR